MSDEFLSIEAEPLRRLAEAIVREGGSSTEEAAIVADHLVRANLAGHDSHGVGMLPAYVHLLGVGLLKPGDGPELIKDDGAILQFDGCRGYGQRVGKEAMEAAIARCRDTGVVLMSLRNTSHLGRIGTYGEQSIAAGLASIHFVNVTDHAPLVAPYGGSDARFSTNPICLAMPGTATTEPTLLDMATSKVAMGKVRVAHNKGVEMPPECIIDTEGQPTNDPEIMFQQPRGALLPFGAHKGYGLALFCDLFAGILSGGSTLQPGIKKEGGVINQMLTIVLDPERLVARDWLEEQVDALIAHVKGSPAAKPDEPVLVAGDPERMTRSERLREGIPIDARSWDEVLAAAETVGIAREKSLSLAGLQD